MTTQIPKTLSAADIMQTDVVTIGAHETLQDALALITENRVTGLPVLDRGRCIGVVSATDILGYEQDNAEVVAEANADVAKYFDPEQERWESLRVSSFALEQFGELPVGEIMSRDIVSVEPETPVDEVARTMVENDVHRVLVLSGRRHLLGIISTFEFVRVAAE